MKLEKETEMLSAYPVCFLKEENGYSVIFPDLNCLATYGETSEETLVMAINCLTGYLYTNEMDRDVIPPPSEMGAISSSETCKELGVKGGEGSMNLVTVNASGHAKNHFEKSVKGTLIILIWLNTAASEKNINFSQVL